MKKYFALLILIPYLFIAGTGQAKRFTTCDDMCKALLMAFQANDSLRYVELCPTKAEATAAFVTPFADSAAVQAAKQKAMDNYYGSTSIAYTKFRMERNKVIAAKLDWKAATFVSANPELLKNRGKGIDYLYNVTSVWKIGDREIGVTLANAMKTAEGWSCGMELKIAVPPAGSHIATASNNAAHLKADSTRLADSVNKAVWVKHHQDSIAAAHKTPQPK